MDARYSWCSWACCGVLWTDSQREGGVVLEYLIGGLVIAFLIFFVIGAMTGRLQTRSCCAISDPRQDLRMRAAYQDESVPPSATS